MSERAEDRWDVHLNLNIRGLPSSATVALNDLSNELLRSGRNIFKLGLGQSPFPVPEVVVEALREHAAKKAYLPVKGLQELREAVAEHHRGRLGIDCEPDDVLIGPGSKELMFLLQLVYYGDLVIPAPAWVSYAPQARIIGRHIRLLSTFMEDDWHLTPEQLEDLCKQDLGRPRILILNYPSNPTGRTISEERLKAIAEVARKHRVVLLSDEIYGLLHHEGTHRSIVPMYPEGTIFSSGLSKWCGAGGWRLGVFVFPKRLRWLLDAMSAVASETYTSTSAPIQYAAVRAFQGGPDIEHYLQQSRRVLHALGCAVTDRLRKTGAEVLAPHGAFYLFPDFSPLRDNLNARGIRTGPQMCQRLLAETGVAVLPGSNFGRPPDEFTARLAYVDFNGAEALRAVESIPMGQSIDEAFLREHCGRVMEAADRLCDWMETTR
ncbi:MAG: pyridoxal phosphate-dependent aminotransferase [Planctomycetota bacterium]|nr:pyridoxal phosphate-dependent aminotransferase [Planctomycetota bacterium]